MNSHARCFMIIFSLSLAIGVAVAQKNKPWTQWTAKDAEKVLADSGWAQSFSEIDTSETMWSPGARPIDSKGAVNSATGVNYHIMFLSAKPIRLAYLRLAELSPAQSTAQQIEKMRQFAESKYEKTIVIAVTYDGTDQRYTAPVFQAFSSAITSTLKNNTFLDIKGGKRIFLQEYQPPVVGENLGAKFIFPRVMDDQPILTAKNGDVRFYAEFPRLSGNNQQVKLDMRFTVSKFMYEGVLEF